MVKTQRKFSNRRNSNKTLHGCVNCGTSTYLSAFTTHNGNNLCVCGTTFRQITKKQARGVI
jgi:cytidylate kinase